MSKTKSKYIDLKILARNLKRLRKQANLSLVGLEKFSGYSYGHLWQLEQETNNITPNLSTLAAFSTSYDVKIDDLIKKEDLDLGGNIQLLQTFIKNNENTPEYLYDKDSLPSFISNYVLPLPKMKTGMRVSEIIKLFPDEKITSKELSRELYRLYNKGILERYDKTGKGSVFFYKLKPNYQNDI